MIHNNEVTGRILGIRRLGGIAFLKIGWDLASHTTVVFERRRLLAQDFTKIKRFRYSDYCRIEVTLDNDEIFATRIISHYSNSDGFRISHEQAALLKSYSLMIDVIRCYFKSINVLEIRLPTIHYGLARGSLFYIDFYGLPARLTSSNALFADIYSTQMGPVYSIQKCFRAEPSHTRRHLSEFDLLEVALPDYALEDGMKMLEQLVYYVVRTLTDANILSCLNSDSLIQYSVPFKRVSFSDIEDKIVGNRINASSAEILLIDSAPVFIVGFPHSQSSWTAEHTDNKYSASFNLLLPHVGEVAEGTQRYHDVKRFKRMFHALGLDKQLCWYRDGMVYNGLRTVGFGLGLERLAMSLFRLANIRQLHPIYRDTRFSEIH